MKTRTGGLTRRQALVTVAGIVGTLHARPVASTQYGRVMLLVLDDVQEIQIRYRGRVASVNPTMVIDALSGKGEQE